MVAHQFGHLVQDILGSIGHAQQDPPGASSGSVRTEFKAGHYAGVWIRYSSTQKGPQDGATLPESHHPRMKRHSRLTGANDTARRLGCDASNPGAATPRTRRTEAATRIHAQRVVQKDGKTSVLGTQFKIGPDKRGGHTINVLHDESETMFFDAQGPLISSHPTQHTPSLYKAMRHDRPE